MHPGFSHARPVGSSRASRPFERRPGCDGPRAEPRAGTRAEPALGPRQSRPAHRQHVTLATLLYRRIMPTRPEPPQPPTPRPPLEVSRPDTRGRGSAPAREPRARVAPVGPVALALAIGRAGIGLELAEPAEIECFRVVELSTSLPGVRFPVDVSGGVARFRHRRGELQTLRLEMAARDLERWMAPRLGGLVGTRSPEVWIQVGRARSTICVSAVSPEARSAVSPLSDAGGAARDFADGGTGRDPPIVAFDVHALAEGEGLVLVVSNARGASLPEPPTAIAIACLGAVLGASALRAGAVFTLPRPATLIVLALFPSAGARLPSTDGVRWAALAADGGTWVMHAARDADVAAPTDDALRAREVAVLLAEADETLLRGDMSAARSLYLEVLERAPRHREIAARIVEIDARMPVRAEAALATIAESSREASGPSARDGGAGTGFVTGELLAQVGDSDAAVASFVRAGEAEPSPALAARAFELAARTSPDAEAASRWLDRALALAPRSVSARWRRVDARLDAGPARGRTRRRRASRSARPRCSGQIRGLAPRRARLGGTRGGRPRRTDLRARASLRTGRTSRPRQLGRCAPRRRAARARRIATRPSTRDRPLARRGRVVDQARARQGARGAAGRPTHRDRARLGHPWSRTRGGGRKRTRGPLACAPRRPSRSGSRLREASRRCRFVDGVRALERRGRARDRGHADRGRGDGAGPPQGSPRRTTTSGRRIARCFPTTSRPGVSTGRSALRSLAARTCGTTSRSCPHGRTMARTLLPPESEREDRAQMPALDLGLADDGVGDEDVERAARVR